MADVYNWDRGRLARRERIARAGAAADNYELTGSERADARSAGETLVVPVKTCS